MGAEDLGNEPFKITCIPKDSQLLVPQGYEYSGLRTTALWNIHKIILPYSIWNKWPKSIGINTTQSHTVWQCFYILKHSPEKVGVAQVGEIDRYLSWRWSKALLTLELKGLSRPKQANFFQGDSIVSTIQDWQLEAAGRWFQVAPTVSVLGAAVQSPEESHTIVLPGYVFQNGFNSCKLRLLYFHALRTNTFRKTKTCLNLAQKLVTLLPSLSLDVF